ncbi:class I SAM-dependent DNA methyltransferase [Chitinophagaceae bacterium MMS25-I14]
MFTKSAHIYDLVYSFKDYRAEADKIGGEIHRLKPEARTLLDIACGTGEHHRYLKENFSVDGTDINEHFLEIARQKNPEGTYSNADMRSFELGRKYDVVTCLFSSVGYLKNLDEITSALRSFYNHLSPGGLLIVEPWFTEDNWKDGNTNMQTHNTDEVKVCRMHRSYKEGNISVLDFHYLIGTKDKDIQYFEERHELRLTSVAEMMEALVQAGFKSTYDPAGFTGRGVYYAIRN